MARHRGTEVVDERHGYVEHQNDADAEPQQRLPAPVKVIEVNLRQAGVRYSQIR